MAILQKEVKPWNNNLTFLLGLVLMVIGFQQNFVHAQSKLIPVIESEFKFDEKINKAVEKYGENSKQVLIIYIERLRSLKNDDEYREVRIELYKKMIIVARTLKDDDLVANSLGAYGMELVYAKNDTEAKSVILEAMQIYKRLGKENGEFNASLGPYLSDIYERNRKYGQALQYLEKSLRIRENLYGKNSTKIVESLASLGSFHKRLGNYTKALPFYRKKFTILYKNKAGTIRDVAGTMGSIATLYVGMGKYKKALSAYNSILKFNKKQAIGDERVARVLMNIGGIHGVLGECTLGLEYLRKSQLIWDAKKYVDHDDLAETLGQIANIYSCSGQYEEALSYHKQSLAKWEQMQSNNQLSIALSQNGLADAYLALGQYNKALSLYEQSLTSLRKTLPNEHPLVAHGLIRMANFYITIGQYEIALKLSKESLTINEKILPKNHPDIGFSLYTIANVYTHTSQYKLAVNSLDRSFDIYSSAFPDGHPLMADLLFDFAIVLDLVGGLKINTLKFREHGLKLRQKFYSVDHPLIAASLNSIGYKYLWLNNIELARVTFTKAILIAQINPIARNTLWRSQQGLSSIYVKENRNDLAIYWAKEAVNTIQSLRGGLAGLKKNMRTSFLVNKRSTYQTLAELLITEGRISEAQVILQMLKEQEFYNSVQRTSKIDPRSTLIKLTGLEQKRFAKYYELRDQQVILGKERAELIRKQKLGELSKTEKKRLTNINAEKMPLLREAMLVFLKNLQKQSDQFAKNKAYRQGEAQLDVVETNLQKAMIQVQQNNLDAGIAALQYVVTDNRLSILLSTPGNPPIAKQIKFDGKKLASDILTVRELLIASHSSEADSKLLNTKLKSLYKLLIEPIAKELKTLKTKTLILVPNDVLRYIPFAALYDGKRYLIQDYTLTLFNEAVKKDFSTSPAKNIQLVAMGLSQAVDKFPALSMVPDELTAVAVTSGIKGKTYLDEAFTQVVLKDTLKQDFTILHLASHFEFVPGRADASRFFLGDKSSLYLGDIARQNFRFDNFSLVTFSACETGLGGGLDADGSEMESLGALVQNQGARAVMATLWKVADKSTSEFMSLFYRYYHELKLTKAEALRKTQLRFIKAKSSGRRTWSRPYFWAPFVLMGDWR